MTRLNDPMCWQLSLAPGAADNARNRNARFGRMDSPGDIKFSSRGAGVSHRKVKPSRAMIMARRLDGMERKYDVTPETRLIRNGVVVVG